MWHNLTIKHRFWKSVSCRPLIKSDQNRPHGQPHTRLQTRDRWERRPPPFPSVPHFQWPDESLLINWRCSGALGCLSGLSSLNRSTGTNGGLEALEKEHYLRANSASAGSRKVQESRKESLIRAGVWEGDATKHFSVKKRVFQWKGGRQFSESRVW